MGLCTISSTAAHGGGMLPFPLGRCFRRGEQKDCAGMYFPAQPNTAHKPILDFPLVKRGKYLYNECWRK